MAALLLVSITALFMIEIEDTIYADGKIMPELPFEIVGHVDGRVVKLLHQEGDDVVQGEVLAVVDSLPYEEQLVSTRAALLEQEADLQVKKAELAALELNPLPKELWYAEDNLKECTETARRTEESYERYLKLYKLSASSKKILDEAEIDNIQAQAALARARINYQMVNSGLAARNIEKAQRSIDLIQSKIDGLHATLDLCAKRLSECKVTAPANGRIVEMPCKYTMYVEKGKMAAKMATGLSLKGLAYVDEKVVRKIRPGQDVRISSGVFNRLEFGSFHGKVDRIRDVPEDAKTAVSAKYPVEIIIDSDGRELKFGSSAEFAIVAGREPVIYAFLGISKEDFRHPAASSAPSAMLERSASPNRPKPQ